MKLDNIKINNTKQGSAKSDNINTDTMKQGNIKQDNAKLTENVIAYLKRCGAELVGIGDMKEVKNCSFPVGISVAVRVPAKIVKDLKTAPTKEYYDMYDRLNEKLNQIVTVGEKYLEDLGYQAYAMSTDRVEFTNENETLLPHKTVAVHAGLGWVGKNCLLVTREFGPAIRLSSLLD